MEKLLFQHKTFKVVTFGDWEIYYQLPIETQKKAILLNPNLRTKHLNLLNLSLEVYGSKVTSKFNEQQDLNSDILLAEVGDEVVKVKSTVNCEEMFKFYENRLLKDFIERPQQLERTYSPTAPKVATWN